MKKKPPSLLRSRFTLSFDIDTGIEAATSIYASGTECSVLRYLTKIYLLSRCQI